VQQPRGRQRHVAHDFRLGAEPRAARQQPVVRVPLQKLRRGLGGLSVGGGRDDRAEQLLLAPAALHELDGEPVEQVGVARLRRADAEVLGRLDDPRAEQGLPGSVGCDAGRRGRSLVHEPLREREAVAPRPVLVGERVEELGDAGRHRARRLLPVAAVEDRRLLRVLRPALGEVEHRRHALGVLRPELVDLVVDRLELRDGRAPVGEDGGLLLGSALRSGDGQRVADGARERVGLGVGGAREAQAEAAEEVALAAVHVAAGVAELQRHLQLGAGVAERSRLLQLHDRLGVRVAPAGAAVGGPGGFVLAVHQELRGAEQALVVLAPLPVVAELLLGLLEVRGGGLELERLPLAADRLGLEHHFANGEGAVLVAPRAAEGEVAVRERFEAQAGDVGLLRRGGDVQLPVAGAEAEGED
jgi:hypothetical protein